MKEKNDIDILLGTRMTFAEFFRLRTEVNRLKNNLDIRGKLSRRLKTIFKSKRKGSRIIRNRSFKHLYRYILNCRLADLLHLFL